jgi:D-psicose/D-tagatose/L-ribulose 3-epimerase
MNKLGVNLFLWTTTMDEDLRETFGYLKGLGCDLVEVPIASIDLAKWARIGQQLDEAGLERVACSIAGPGHDFINPDATVRHAAVTHLKAVVDAAVALGASLLTGPYHSAFKTFTGVPPTEQEFAWSVEGMREVAQHAEARGVKLGLEYLNRFESYLLTSADELIRYVEAVGHPCCRLMYDTFHAHVEEKNSPEALRRCAPYLVSVQFSENDRAIPGTGQVDFAAHARVLQEIGYDGPVFIESFGLTPPELAAAAHIVRKRFDSPEQVAAEGMKLMQRLLREEVAAVDVTEPDVSAAMAHS